MPNTKLRRQIAWEAARLMYEQQESEYHLAKVKAADELGKGSIPSTELPTNAEIRQLIRQIAQQTVYEFFFAQIAFGKLKESDVLLLLVGNDIAAVEL